MCLLGHFWVLDKSPVSGPGRDPPSCNRFIHHSLPYSVLLFPEASISNSFISFSWVLNLYLYTVEPHYSVPYLRICPAFPGGSDSKESACNAGDPGSIPGSRRSSGEGNGYPLQYSCLENSIDRGTWQATVDGVTKSQMWLNNKHTLLNFICNSKINIQGAFAADNKKSESSLTC